MADTAQSQRRALDDDDDIEESSNKRLKTSHSEDTRQLKVETAQAYDVQGLLPKSLSLLGLEPTLSPDKGHPVTREVDVGISEYVSTGVAQIGGIIKQRFTDFLVYEIDEAGRVIHLSSLEEPSPDPPKQEQTGEVKPVDEIAWSEDFDKMLQPYMSHEATSDLRALYLQGPPTPPTSSSRPKDSRGRGGRKRGRGGRAEHYDAPAGQPSVTSLPLSSKEDRTKFHQLVRELFSGRLDSRATEAVGEEGPRISVQWANPNGRNRREPRGDRPPGYIHFTLQKVNRDTQDALSKLARSLGVAVKDLGVAGTKDKRGVTTQRVSLKRGRYSLHEAWKVMNGVQGGKRSKNEAVTQRAERGMRVGDFEYRPSYLELGMLSGNAFVITLRNLKVDTEETVRQAMSSLGSGGFINYYGMQRFGTAAIPTHAIGLAVLKSDWQLAVSLILRPRPGEHPDVERGRRAWLGDGDIDTALHLIPRRCVAERCILEYFQKKKSHSSPAEALAMIPRNLRLMYVHAYQSYVWNAIVSERIRLHGCQRPFVGDLVLDNEREHNMEETSDTIKLEGQPSQAEPTHKVSKKPGKKEFIPPKIKVLQETDLERFSIFDVVMPLPGIDVAYPAGPLGDRYKAFLLADGLDPDNLKHGNKDYTLMGSYRHMLHVPKDLSWSILRYTDPDIPLAQSDEDQILGLDPPSPSPSGKFMALQIRLQLGTAAYATMALREITKMDTSSQSQTALTQASEDQAYRGMQDDQADEEAEPSTETKVEDDMMGTED